MAASVSTRVVSWKLAAEMNESVDSDALVMPSRIAWPSAGLPPVSITFWFSSRNRNLSTTSSGRFGVADVLHLHPAHHLSNDDLQVLVVDVNALQAIHFLDLVHQVFLQ